MTFTWISLLTVSCAYFALPTAAQNNTADECPGIIGEARGFNATGDTAISITDDDDWHVSMSWQFRLARNTSEVRDVDSYGYQSMFISLPESFIEADSSNETRICFYQMDGLNATTDEDAGAGNTCNGILSEECQEALRNATPPPVEGRCPRLDIEDACERPLRLWTSTATNFTGSGCSGEGLEEFGLPSDYQTFGAMSQGIPLPVDEEGFLEAYDLRTRQHTPILITARLPGGNTGAEIACLAADDIVEDSRVPEGDFPPDSANGLDVRRAVVYSLAVFCIICLL